MSNIKFGTDGWRAVIADDFTFENVKVVGQAIADYLLKENNKITIAIGYDTRFMSEDYAKLVSCVLSANGINVLFPKRIAPTPVLSYNVVFNNIHGGVMITASHNPPHFNGIKFKGSYGGPADSKETKQIEIELYKTEPKYIDFDTGVKQGLIKIVDMDKPYVQKIMDYVDLDLIKDSGFKVMVDSMFGAGCTYIEDFLTGGNTVVKTIHGTFNPSFCGINPEPIYYNLEELSRECRQSYDLGIATDGDADRVGIVSDKGDFIFSHELIALLAIYLKQEKKMDGGIIKSISTTSLINLVAKDIGCKLYETPVGFKYICELMQKEDILIGGEESGGIGYKNYLPERDGILSGLLILEMMAFYKKSFSSILDELRNKYGRLFYDRIDIKYEKSQMEKILDAVGNIRCNDILGNKVKEIKDFDGVKHILEDGSWLLIRASGTEPILRIYAESKDKEFVQKLLKFGNKLIFGE